MLVLLDELGSLCIYRINSTEKEKERKKDIQFGSSSLGHWKLLRAGTHLFNDMPAI